MHDVTQTVNDDDVVTNTTTNNSDDQDGDVNVTVNVHGNDDCGCNSCGCYPCCCNPCCGQKDNGANVNVSVVKKNMTVNYGGPNYPVGYYDHQGGGVGANVSSGHAHGCGCGCEEVSDP